MTKKLALFLSIIAAPALAWGDSLQISCASPPECTAGTYTQISSLSDLTLSLTNPGGNLIGDGYLAVAVPPGEAAPSIANVFWVGLTFDTGTGSLGTGLGEDGIKDFAFSSFVTASAQVGVHPASYTVYEFGCDEHGVGCLGPSFEVTGLAPGDVLVGWTEKRNKDEVLQQTFLDPHNGNGRLTSLTIGSQTTASPVPEPATMFLLGSGLLAVATAAKRRFRKK